MPTILDEILADKRKELVVTKASKKIEDLERADYFERATYSLKDSLKNSASGIISEFKRKSPSKGWIFPDADPVAVTKGYNDNGASAISILTNNKYFGGDPEFLLKSRPNITCPVLRKEFIVDEFQVYEAKAIGADAILLIAAALTKQELKALAAKAHELSLQVLLEVHTEEELDYVNEFVDVVGVNNRNLKTFVTDVENSVRLADKIPADFVKISESGISKPETVRSLREIGYRGFLMGENFMKTQDPAAALKSFIDAI
ncbi:MAG: indole-3-glycerol phosphate synthase TrpC [Paludibacteraceae bacterium]|nr:indole-3-glycerol phosphate synthase TrpC [Paludibacteraceae bacterium]MBO7337766.1 indole-3-glycerol phosphate synthase TrpC [Paludibacteraceae bacterium]MBP5136569.1 indole-3-glycerol phosphate synthase TrpC [Paludibacteraceae bacterium]MBP5743248.1 indole-3-glycerol phosphate synthase TrpC [Paludibacteraceae bacterium]